MTKKRISANAAEAQRASPLAGPAGSGSKNSNTKGRNSLSNLSDDGYRSDSSDLARANRIQIPGLPGDPYSMIQGRKAHQGAREQFKAIYIELWPYYVDFRQANKDSKVIQEFGKSVLDVARMLARLLAFSKAYLAVDSDQVKGREQKECVDSHFAEPLLVNCFPWGCLVPPPASFTLMISLSFVPNNIDQRKPAGNLRIL